MNDTHATGGTEPIPYDDPVRAQRGVRTTLIRRIAGMSALFGAGTAFGNLLSGVPWTWSLPAAALTAGSLVNPRMWADNVSFSFALRWQALAIVGAGGLAVSVEPMQTPLVLLPVLTVPPLELAALVTQEKRSIAVPLSVMLAAVGLAAMQPAHAPAAIATALLLVASHLAVGPEVRASFAPRQPFVPSPPPGPAAEEPQPLLHLPDLAISRWDHAGNHLGSEGAAVGTVLPADLLAGLVDATRISQLAETDRLLVEEAGDVDGERFAHRSILFRTPDGYGALTLDDRDADARRRELLAATKRLDLATRGAMLGVWEWNLDDAVHLSERAARLLSLAPDERDATSLAGRYPEAVDVFRDAVRAHLRDRHPLDLELSLSPAPEVELRLRVRGRASWRRGRAVRIAGTLEDITASYDARVGLEAEAQRAASANVAKTLFLANMSHELRTPMNAIVGMAQLLTHTELAPHQLECASVISSASEELLALVDDVLDIAKVEQGTLVLDKAPMDLVGLCQEVVRRFEAPADAKGIALEFRPELGLPSRAVGDALRFKQVLTNLVNNALKFTPEGKILVTLSGERHDDRVAYVLRVADTGVGIPPEKRDAIFGRFMQVDAAARRAGGSGLGLAIVAHIVELMHGQIRVESTVGEGSIFEVALDLPAAEAPSRSKPSDDRATPLPFAVRVLVAEDNLVNQRVIPRMLDLLDAECTLVSDGEAAVAKASQRAFDAILMDVEMPKLDGVQAALEVRRANQHIPIIALTAHATSTDRERCEAAGMNGYLTKPVRIDSLRAELLRHVAPPSRPDDASIL